MYKVLCRKEDFNGFYLDEDVSSENNTGIIERVIAQVLHEHGGQERCPWTRAIMEAALQRYFLSLNETRRLKNNAKYEEHKRMTRKSGRQREKLTRRTSALELVKWADHHKKGRAAEVLVMDAMSSEDSCYEDDENGNPKVAKYAVRKLPWESRAMKKIKKKLDKAYRKRLSKRAKERIVTRTEAEELSERQPPNAFPEWALKETEN